MLLVSFCSQQWAQRMPKCLNNSTNTIMQVRSIVLIKLNWRGRTVRYRWVHEISDFRAIGNDQLGISYRNIPNWECVETGKSWCMMFRLKWLPSVGYDEFSGKLKFLMENIRGRPKVSSGSKFRCDELYIRRIVELFAYLKISRYNEMIDFRRCVHFCLGKLKYLLVSLINKTLINIC